MPKRSSRGPEPEVEVAGEKPSNKRKLESETTVAAPGNDDVGPKPPPQPYLPSPLPKTFEGLADAVTKACRDHGANPLEAVQAVIDRLPYNTDDEVRCPADAAKAGKVHCLDGALLAAALLEKLGFQDIYFTQLTAVEDDDHLLCVVKVSGFYGVIAKSNFVGLRYRDPIYKTLRELVMTYFQSYFSLEGMKTLRGYTALIPLSKFSRRQDWTDSRKLVDSVNEALWKAKEFTLLPPHLAEEKKKKKRVVKKSTGKLTDVRTMGPVDVRTFQSGTVGIDLAGCHGYSGGKEE